MSTPKSKRGRKRKTAKGDDPSEINRSFSQQARDRFTVLFEETMRHLDGLSLTFTATSGAGIVPVSTIKSEFSRVFRERMDKLVHDIEAQENTTRDGNFGQNPKEKWGVFQEDVDGMVGCMYEFIEWASGSMTKDPLGRMYIIAELLDGIFGAVWSSKQGLKHVWNKGILDKKQDFFCLAKILDHFPLLADFCDDVARNRLGPDRNTSWTEVVQDLRNIRLRTVAAFVNREHKNTETTETDVATFPATVSETCHRSSAPPALIPYVKEVPSQQSLKSETSHRPASGSLFPSDRRVLRDGNYTFDEPKDTSMEDVMEQMTTSQSKEELSLPLPPRPIPQHAFGRYPVFSEMSGTSFSSIQKISTNEPLLVPMSYSIPQGSQEFDRHCSAVPLVPRQNSSLPPRIVNHEIQCFQQPLPLDRNTLRAILNDPTDYDFEMEDFDDNDKCIFDIGPNMATMLTSVEELKLADLAATGKLSNGSI